MGGDDDDDDDNDDDGGGGSAAFATRSPWRSWYKSTIDCSCSAELNVDNLIVYRFRLSKAKH